MSFVSMAILFTLEMLRSLCLQTKLLKETIKWYEKINVAYVTAKNKCFIFSVLFHVIKYVYYESALCSSERSFGMLQIPEHSLTQPSGSHFLVINQSLRYKNSNTD